MTCGERLLDVEEASFGSKITTLRQYSNSLPNPTFFNETTNTPPPSYYYDTPASLPLFPDLRLDDFSFSPHNTPSSITDLSNSYFPMTSAFAEATSAPALSTALDPSVQSSAERKRKRDAPMQTSVISPYNVGSSALANVYSSSGFDMLSILAKVHGRKDPKIQLGYIDCDTSFVVVDARKEDFPIVYANENFVR